MTAFDNLVISDDEGWFAFPADWTRQRVARWLLRELDLWLREHPAVTIDDDDCLHGWVTAYRDLLGRIQRGHVRLAEEDDLVPDDWWLPADADHPGAQPAWVVEL